MIYPPATGTLSTRNLAIRPGPEYPWLHQVTWLRDVGKRVVLSPAGNLDTSRVGFLIDTADSSEAAQDSLSCLADALTLSVTP
ncbi:hypothetical protein [Streptomyces sp. H27-C3]|uniref:hypothetical protein n=1 Tax=Streptomyces sp. H27-C3 TaxID=3046305 RepID=UPI0024BBC687|nr:hypothetical protein [Streptomyces sp. H27-C3]MDJ0465733.1 hypothetical protein [Streptomyces sp. H27-C3]